MPTTAPVHVVLLGGLLGLVLAASAGAETVNCTAITSLPHMINTPGVHCLTASLTTSISSGNAIEIAASPVVLDLNGFRLYGTAGSATAAAGIHAKGRRNLTIRNGTVSGFYRGIHLEEGTSAKTVSAGHIVEDLRLDGNWYAGIEVHGANCVVRKNLIESTGGSMLGGAAAILTSGIIQSGAVSRILDNDVVDTHTGTSYGISVGQSTGVVVEGNRISNPTLPGTGTSIGIGIGGLLSPAHDVLVVGNRISKTTTGILFQSVGADGKYRDNLTAGVTTPLVPGAGGVDAGNNH